MNEILQYLKKHGERLDAEIAEAAGLSLSKTRLHLAELAAKGEVMVCDSIRFEKARKSKEYVAGCLGSFHRPSRVGKQRHS